MCYMSGKEMRVFCPLFPEVHSEKKKMSSKTIILQVRTWINSSSIAWECTRNANSQGPAQTKSDILGFRSSNLYFTKSYK